MGWIPVWIEEDTVVNDDSARRLHFVGGDDVETYASCFCGDEKDEHMWIVVEFVNDGGALN